MCGLFLSKTGELQPGIDGFAASGALADIRCNLIGIQYQFYRLAAPTRTRKLQSHPVTNGNGRQTILVIQCHGDHTAPSPGQLLEFPQREQMQFARLSKASHQ